MGSSSPLSSPCNTLTQGLERMDQIKYAVVETSGGITIIPKER
jgi:hypothetical protein